jgi:hypothetical protein
MAESTIEKVADTGDANGSAEATLILLECRRTLIKRGVD